MDSPTVRPPEDEELPALAQLRWQWILENDGVPAMDREEFVRGFAAWAREHRSSHRPLVLLRGRQVIGMAWLAILPRVPSPRAIERSSGDMQCVYVVPRERDSGHGGILVESVVELARELGLERVTVHSSDRAVPAYERRGFRPSHLLLQSGVAPRSERDATPVCGEEGS